MRKKILFILLSLCFFSGFSQPISLYRQFLGQYDFTMIGNTLNSAPSVQGQPCTIFTQSSAVLNLNTDQTVVAAYLYWSGMGSPEEGDLDIELNGTPISAQRVLTNIEPLVGESHFGAFADVTDLVKNTGNGSYLFSDFDAIDTNCAIGVMNYAGWAIVIIYEEPTLSNRMVNIYDGLEKVSPQNSIYINLDRLSMTDTSGAKLGFLVWDGDDSIIGDELWVNGNVVSNPPLNPANNIFNATNSYTGSNMSYDMDLDYFAIDNYISVNDMSIDIDISSGPSDVVLANVFAVTLINQLPDATIVMDNVTVTCDSRDVGVSYTVSNFNASEVLPAGTPIAFYADDVLVGTTTTRSSIAIRQRYCKRSR